MAERRTGDTATPDEATAPMAPDEGEAATEEATADGGATPGHLAEEQRRPEATTTTGDEDTPPTAKEDVREAAGEDKAAESDGGEADAEETTAIGERVPHLAAEERIGVAHSTTPDDELTLHLTPDDEAAAGEDTAANGEEAAAREATAGEGRAPHLAGGRRRAEDDEDTSPLGAQDEREIDLAEGRQSQEILVTQIQTKRINCSFSGKEDTDFSKKIKFSMRASL